MSINNSIKSITEALQEHDENRLFRILFEGYNKYLTAIITRICGSRIGRTIGPEDIIQDVFLKVKKEGGINLFSIEKVSTIKAFLAKITRHACHDYLKKSDAEYKYLQTGESTQLKEISVPPDTYDFHFTDNMEWALSKLPAKQKEIFTLKLNGFTFPEIADKMQETESNVKYHFYEAKEKLIILLECPKE